MPGKGFLPDPNRQRKPGELLIPSTLLPAGGRPGPVPKPPAWIELGQAAMAWWKWAWKTPQAAAWDPGAMVFLAHRASLEDDLAALDDTKGFDVLAALDADTDDRVATLVRRLARLATGHVAIVRECREIDNRLGLTPRGFADLRWKIVADEPEVAPTDGVADLDDRRRRLA